MYNSVLDLNFLNNTIKLILYCYGIIQYLNLVQRCLLSCDNYFFSHDHSGLSAFSMALCNFF